MDIIVLMKQVPDTAAEVEIADNRKGIETENIKWSINPYDEYSVEEALLIKEKLGKGNVTVITAGPDRVSEAIRVVYAMGADRVIQINDQTDNGEPGAVDACTTARLLTAVLKTMPYDLIIAGQRAVDDDSYQVPAFISEMLNIPMISMVVKQEVGNEKIVCEQAVEGGTIVVEAPLPALFTAHKGINEPRYPTFRAIMKARERDFDRLNLEDIGLKPEDSGHNSAKVSIRSLSYPPERKAGKVIEGESVKAKAVNLVRLLREDAEVI